MKRVYVLQLVQWQILFFLSLLFFALVSFLFIKEKVFTESLKIKFVRYQEKLDKLTAENQSLISKYSNQPNQMFSNLSLEFLTLPSYSLR